MRTIASVLTIVVLFSSIAFSEDYFPLARGNQWAYSLSNGAQLTTKIVDFNEINGINCAVVESTAKGPSGTETSLEYLAVDNEGLKLYMSESSGGQVFFEPPVLRIKLPFKQGDIWTSSIEQAGTTLTTTFEAARTETISTPAGKFKCIVIRSRLAVPGQLPITSENYYADGTGLVYQKIQTPSETIQYTLTLVKAKPTEIKAVTVVCPNCGAKLPSDAKFCPSCGAEIKAKPTDANLPAVPVVDANQEKIIDKYVSTTGKVMLFKPKNWEVIEQNRPEGAYAMIIKRPDDTALVVFMTFPASNNIINSLKLADICMNSFKTNIPDLEGSNTKSSKDKNLTTMDISFTEGNEKGVGNGYFFFTEQIGTAYLLLARDDKWGDMHEILTNIASNIAYSPDKIEKAIKEGSDIADKTIFVTQERIQNPAAMLQKTKNAPLKKMELISSGVKGTFKLQIPKDWHLEGQETEYLLYDDTKTREHGVISQISMIIQSRNPVPGILNLPYQPPAQALSHVLELNRIGKDMEVLAELPAEQADSGLSSFIQESHVQNLQVDSRLIHARFKSITSPEKTIEGIFTVQCMAMPLSPVCFAAIDGSWAPDDEYSEWLPLYLKIGRTYQPSLKSDPNKPLSQNDLLMQVTRKSQNTIAESGKAFDEYISNLQDSNRRRDFTSWMLSRTSLGQTAWVARNEGAVVNQADSFGAEGPDGGIDSHSYNTAKFTGENPWGDTRPKLIDSKSEYDRYGR